MIMYRTNNDTHIQKYEVLKATAARITFVKHVKNFAFGCMETRTETEAIYSRFHSWHNSFDDAKKHLLSKFEAEIEDLTDLIEYRKRKIETIETLIDL